MSFSLHLIHPFYFHAMALSNRDEKPRAVLRSVMRRTARCSRGLTAASIIALSQCSVAFAETAPAVATTGTAVQQSTGNPSGARGANGILVDADAIQVHDNRQLTLMFETLSSALRDKQFVDTAKLLQAIGTIQGGHVTDSSRALSLSTLPLPSMDSQSGTDLANNTKSSLQNSQEGMGDVAGKNSIVENNSTDITDKSNSSVKIGRAAITPAAPVLATSDLGAPKDTSLSAVSLLDEQVDLSYRVFNLRMLLERSLTARMLQNGQPRLQTVLEIPVSFAPSQIVVGASAVVEVTVTAVSGQPDGLLSVATMSDENAFNATEMSTKSNAFSGAAVIKVVQIGYSQKSAEKTYFVYRDSDTITYRKPTENSNSVTLGWEFRPVLGRAAISTKERHLFVVLALPQPDLPATEAKATEGHELSVTIATRWKKFDKRTVTSSDEDAVNRRTRFKWAVSFGNAKPEYFNAGEQYSARTLFVPTTQFYQERLAPEVIDTKWSALGTKTALLNVSGKNFFTGTRIALGDKLYESPTDGLVIKDQQNLELITSFSAVASGTGAVLGRYGSSKALRATVDPRSGAGFKIDSFSLEPAVGGRRYLEAKLTIIPDRCTPPDWNSASRPKLILTINGSALPPPYDYEQSGTSLIVRTQVPESLVPASAADLRAVIPFAGETWTSRKSFSDPNSYYRVETVSDNVVLFSASDPTGFRDQKTFVAPDDTTNEIPPSPRPWRLRWGNDLLLVPETVDVDPATGSASGKSPGALRRLSSHSFLASASALPTRAILISPDDATFLLEVPQPKKEEKRPAETLSVKQGDAVWVDVEIKNKAEVKSVQADRIDLRFQPKKKDEKEDAQKSAGKDGDKNFLRVELAKTLTGTAREVDITVFFKDADTTDNNDPFETTRLVIKPNDQKEAKKE